MDALVDGIKIIKGESWVKRGKDKVFIGTMDEWVDGIWVIW